MNLDLKPRLRAPRWAPAALVAGLAALALSPAGPAAPAFAKTTSKSKVPPILAPCLQVSAVLSDGPDPGADPVGYAQAQIIQLRKLKLSDKKLEHAVRELASAYALFAKTDGKSKPAKADVKKAVKAVNAICPGAAS